MVLDSIHPHNLQAFYSCKKNTQQQRTLTFYKVAPKVLVTLKTKNIENISEKDNTRKQFSCVIIKEIPCDFWHRNVSIHLNFMNLKEVIVKVYVVSTKKHYK